MTDWIIRVYYLICRKLCSKIYCLMYKSNSDLYIINMHPKKSRNLFLYLSLCIQFGFKLLFILLCVYCISLMKIEYTQFTNILHSVLKLAFSVELLCNTNEFKYIFFKSVVSHCFSHQLSQLIYLL